MSPRCKVRIIVLSVLNWTWACLDSSTAHGLLWGPKIPKSVNPQPDLHQKQQILRFLTISNRNSDVRFVLRHIGVQYSRHTATSWGTNPKFPQIRSRLVHQTSRCFEMLRDARPNIGWCGPSPFGRCRLLWLWCACEFTPHATDLEVLRGASWCFRVSHQDSWHAVALRWFSFELQQMIANGFFL